MKGPARGEILSAEQAMRLAISEAARGAAHVSPNPTVGCVILDARGGFLSAGHHEKYGTAHAEVNAVNKLAPSDLAGAQVFVTLEPCAHEGQTPSCAKMLAKLPLGRVVFGVVDPNPLVSGQGARILREAGLRCDLYRDVYGDALEVALEECCEIFLWNFRHKTVFVSLKVASSLDGKIALADGSSQWITGPAAREKGHELRAIHDAVLIGSGTLRMDDPSLDVRHPRITKKNKVVVLGRPERAQERAWKLQLSHAADEIFWMSDGNLGAVLRKLWDAGVRSVLIEGGARVSGAFLNAGLVNRLHLFQAPTIMGSQTRSWSEGFQVAKMSEKPILRHPTWTTLGPDLHLSALLRDPLSGDISRNA